MDPITLGVIAAIVGGIGAGIRASEAVKQNKLITDIQTQLDAQAQLNQDLFTKREQQLRAQANQAKTERLIQFYKQLGAQAVWSAAQGLQGSAVNRLNKVEQIDAAKDIAIIETNLENYLAQLATERDKFLTDVEISKKQYEAQKKSPWAAAWEGFLNTGTVALQIGSPFLK